MLAGGRNRLVAEAYVHAVKGGSPKSFDALEVCFYCALCTGNILEWLTRGEVNRAVSQEKMARIWLC